MLGITFGKQPYGKIKVDFGQDATPLSDIAKPLVLDALANHGALIEEMEDWKAEVKGSTIYLAGYLGESGLTRIASLINLPTHALHAPAADAARRCHGRPGTVGGQPRANSSRRPRSSTSSRSNICWRTCGAVKVKREPSGKSACGSRAMPIEWIVCRF